MTWPLQPKDHVFAAGHRIGVVLISTDRDYTLRYPAGTRVGVDLGLSHAVLPLGPAPG
jgi:X-Pro dipeptidyl-peptidase